LRARAIGGAPKGERIRLFVAAAVPEDQRRALNAGIASVRDPAWGGRWTAPSAQHVTLKFLGWSSADRLEPLGAVIDVVVRGHRPARVALGSVGAFPSLRRARVLWAGLDDPEDLLTGIAADLDHSLEPLGHPVEPRAFTPHLTLARFKTPVFLEGLVPERPWGDLAPFEVAAVDLFRSRLHPEGARYEVLASFALS
jgi:RNA 2',3'-cyclic 3'-phosphodiesterase